MSGSVAARSRCRQFPQVSRSAFRGDGSGFIARTTRDKAAPDVSFYSEDCQAGTARTCDSPAEAPPTGTTHSRKAEREN